MLYRNAKLREGRFKERARVERAHTSTVVRMEVLVLLERFETRGVGYDGQHLLSNKRDSRVRNKQIK